ncbi:Hypothetical protein CINCED_3A018197 [Cinara cedri]|nr:Hypothetical protein CINCED_3A018197 [Cinara cedri]
MESLVRIINPTMITARSHRVTAFQCDLYRFIEELLISSTELRTHSRGICGLVLLTRIEYQKKKKNIKK